jgi:glucosamine 6-phosphate synthetase-like amidotransferase/phosphosugar isomerase protein
VRFEIPPHGVATELGGHFPASESPLPILECVPLQLFAYHFASINGYDVDPRHFVKAVTRE